MPRRAAWSCGRCEPVTWREPVLRWAGCGRTCLQCPQRRVAAAATTASGVDRLGPDRPDPCRRPGRGGRRDPHLLPRRRHGRDRRHRITVVSKDGHYLIDSDRRVGQVVGCLAGCRSPRAVTDGPPSSKGRKALLRDGGGSRGRRTRSNGGLARRARSLGSPPNGERGAPAGALTPPGRGAALQCCQGPQAVRRNPHAFGGTSRGPGEKRGTGERDGTALARRQHSDLETGQQPALGDRATL